MLDLACLKKQLNQLVQQQKEWEDKQHQQLEIALNNFGAFSADWQELATKILASKTSWLVAHLTESPNQRYPLPVRPKTLNVLSSDGSQIFPDRHQLAPWYLINIGLVAISYGTGQRPTLKNTPMLFKGDNPWGIEGAAGREDIGTYRSLLELQELTKLATERAQKNTPTICIGDGTLIWWFLGNKNGDKQQDIRRKKFLDNALYELDKLQELGIPITGYISHPGSSDVVNALRVGLCPLKFANCDLCSFDKDTRECGVIDTVLDRALFFRLLQPKERSAVFKSTSKILDKYAEHHVHFFYLNTGHEIARVEIPQWVAENANHLDLVHATLYDQAQKGQGYPIVLTEAHQQAVVKGAERNLFYQLLEGEFTRNNIRMSTSRKLSAKMRVQI